MKRGADVLGMTVMADGRRIGRVADVLFDDACSRVLGLVLRQGLIRRRHLVIGYSDVEEIRPRAVLVTHATGRVASADEVSALRHDGRSVQGKPIVTRRGEYLGEIRDVLFDETTGRVLGFESAGRPAATRRLRTDVRAVVTAVAAEGVVVCDAAGGSPAATDARS